MRRQQREKLVDRVTQAQVPQSGTWTHEGLRRARLRSEMIVAWVLTHYEVRPKRGRRQS